MSKGHIRFRDWASVFSWPGILCHRRVTFTPSLHSSLTQEKEEDSHRAGPQAHAGSLLRDLLRAGGQADRAGATPTWQMGRKLPPRNPSSSSQPRLTAGLRGAPVVLISARQQKGASPRGGSLLHTGAPVITQHCLLESPHAAQERKCEWVPIRPQKSPGRKVSQQDVGKDGQPGCLAPAVAPAAWGRGQEAPSQPTACMAQARLLCHDLFNSAEAFDFPLGITFLFNFLENPLHWVTYN